MTPAPPNRHPATLRQIAAADPRHSTWVSANAGSGKTRVLTDRVARLLLSGVSPANILCLTYTKAAAAEMQNRLFARLGAWAMKPDAALLAELDELGADIAPSDLARARRLFAQALEVPGGLRIQTIHAFCAGLLRRFPLESGVSPAFAEMDDRAAALLRAEVADRLARGPDAPALAAVGRHFSGDDFDKLLRDIAGRRDAFAAPPDRAAIAASLGLAPGTTAGSLLADVLVPGTTDDLAALAALCRGGSTNDVKLADRLGAFAPGHRPVPADLLILEGSFLFGKDAAAPFTAKAGKIPTKDTRARDPALIARIDALMTRVEAARPQRLALDALGRTLDLHAFARPFLAGLDAAKSERGLVDFDDLIWRARALLTDPAVAQWVLFKLDGGIDHILVDEAQDTSPLQWQVIAGLAQEFAAGDGASPDRERTIFVVGDLKQSIYSFQGAEPEAFGRMQAHFTSELARIGRGLNALTLDYSFRSATAILRLVDLVLASHGEGLGPVEPGHVAFREDLPGRVDLWDPVPPTDTQAEDRAWFDPVDTTGAQHHTTILAEKIAEACAEMIAGQTRPVVRDGRVFRTPVRPGDILILVQRRSDIFASIIRALKARNLPVAGADRLRVGAELAVRDIGAVLRFLALPEDDLSLAAALRSPLFGWSEADLYTLAQPRPERAFLWETLRQSDRAGTLAILNDLRARADFLRPYDLINRLLTRHDGRRRLLARLGPEAEDGIDALLSQALAYEQTGIPSLTGFVEWMRTDDLEVKRQMDAASDQIRVMTVHGAKGLEAPVVFLPDSAIRKPPQPDRILPDGDHAHWPGNKDRLPPALEAAQAARAAAQERERRRLLYVAMTRAESWLVVCAAGETEKGKESWHAMVRDGMEQAGAIRAGHGLRFALGNWDDPPLADDTRPPRAAAEPVTFGPAPPEDATALRPLSPSDLGGAKVLPGETRPEEQQAALARGRVLHRLLEYLPAIAPPDRNAQGLALLSLDDDAAGLGDPGPLVADACALLADPALAHLFAPDALPEVDLTATLHGRRLAGTIDRLLIAPDRILAIDFKTNRLVPDRPDDVPEGILRQMGAYAAMLEQVWPGRRVETALLWTAAPRLMHLPAPLVAAALSRAILP
jgi:ATP-dependent helicase/nuclease subunit A